MKSFPSKLVLTRVFYHSKREAKAKATATATATTKEEQQRKSSTMLYAELLVLVTHIGNWGWGLFLCNWQKD